MTVKPSQLSNTAIPLLDADYQDLARQRARTQALISASYQIRTQASSLRDQANKLRESARTLRAQ
jgi:hypothetical protein